METKILPILFNPDMVLAILDGRKTVTRRVVKYTANDVYDAACAKGIWHEIYDPKDPPGGLIALYVKHMKKSPYQSGDILYVPEAWKCRFAMLDPDGLGYEVIFRDRQHVRFRFETEERAKKWVKYARKPQEYWQSPYFMPREAARIFLRVTDVRVERLQDITDDDIVAEGLEIGCYFDELWDKTIKPADLTLYGWVANPWVWVIEFERISKEEALRNWRMGNDSGKD